MRAVLFALMAAQVQRPASRVEFEVVSVKPGDGAARDAARMVSHRHANDPSSSGRSTGGSGARSGPQLPTIRQVKGSRRTGNAAKRNAGDNASGLIGNAPALSPVHTPEIPAPEHSRSILGL